MKKLTLNQVTALCKWAIENKGENWGTWNSNYPVIGCSYLQYEDNPIVVKFDETVEFAGEKFKRIGWNRNIPGHESFTTFSSLLDELKKEGITFGEYPEKRFTKEIDGKKISYLIRQSPYSNYPAPDVCLLNEDGSLFRESITINSKYYPGEEI